jgi:NADH:ubiquinone oxidoreductase subunit 5 (subunit L)/multisubunit Na+/H+ antiporter MnhA subunit
MVLNFLSFSICFFVVMMILDLCVNYHREITQNTLCPWTIGSLSCGIYIKHLYISYWFLPYLSPKMYLFNSHCLPWLLWFHLILLNVLSVIFNVDRDYDHICVHFVFKCKTVNNALILRELSYIQYNTPFVLISIGIGCCWKTNIFWVLCVPS